MTSLASSHQILDKHTIVDIIYSKWISHSISHLRLRNRGEIALRNPFPQNKSTIRRVWRYNRQHNGQKKKKNGQKKKGTNNDLQTIRIKLKIEKHESH